MVESAVAGQPGHGPLDDPSAASQPFAGLDSLAGDAHSDVLAPKPFPQVRNVVGFVRVQALGLEVAASVGVVSRLVTRDHGLQREAVVGVGRGEADEEGQSVRVRQDVHLGARLAPVHGLGPVSSPPFWP